MVPNKKHKTIAPTPPSNEVIDVEAFVLTPISHRGTNNSTPISVEQYTLDRDLHRAIAASLGLPTSTNNKLIYLSDEENEDVTILTSKPQHTPFGPRKRKNRERGESSNSAQPFDCEICTETKTKKDSFGITGCSHSYCIDCVVMYVASKLQESVMNIQCPVPGCAGLLEPESCREILPEAVFDRWGKALCEAVIVAEERFYCPFKDCSALMIDDGGEVVRESECPNCRRLFCAQCKVPWHDGIECEEFQKLNKDEREKEDIMLMKLAESKKWRRCPKCRFYVEKSQGCMYMRCRLFHKEMNIFWTRTYACQNRCRTSVHLMSVSHVCRTCEHSPNWCGNAFCYNCGAPPNDKTHYCYNCRR